MGWEAEHMSMLQIGILGVAGVLLALQFKSGKSEYGIYISIVLGLLQESRNFFLLMSSVLL